MYDIIVTTRFDATHCLRGYPEDFEVPHAHNWKVVVTVRAAELDELGMGIDFIVLDKLLKKVISELEGQDLNTLLAFAHLNPSTELLAKYIFDNLKGAVQTGRHHLHSVGVSETENCNAIYYGEHNTQTEATE